jgi:hypothetical protein
MYRHLQRERAIISCFTTAPVLTALRCSVQDMQCGGALSKWRCTRTSIASNAYIALHQCIPTPPLVARRAHTHTRARARVITTALCCIHCSLDQPSWSFAGRCKLFGRKKADQPSDVTDHIGQPCVDRMHPTSSTRHSRFDHLVKGSWLAEVSIVHPEGDFILAVGGFALPLLGLWPQQSSGNVCALIAAALWAWPTQWQGAPVTTYMYDCRSSHARAPTQNSLRAHCSVAHFRPSASRT